MLRKNFFIAGIFFMSLFLSACGMSAHKYNGQLRQDLANQNYDKAVKLVEDSKDSFYEEKNILLFNLDAGLTNHYAGNYASSKLYFESAKRNFSDYYTKSVTAGVASFFTNDISLPYYGHDFESVHINVFNALNYLLNNQNNEAAVEARQADALFRANYLRLYKDDGFVRYFMGLVYENAGYINDAYIEYGLAIKAYKNGINGLSAPQDLIDSYYSSALSLGLNGDAASIKSQYPTAQRKSIPNGQGEVIVIDYNGMSPQKVENVLSIAVGEGWAYVSADNVSSAEMSDANTVKDVALSVFSNDYVKVAFPAYKRIPHSVYSFSVDTGNGKYENAYMAQDIATIAEKTLHSEVAKIYAKTIASAVVKYVMAAQVAHAVEKETDNALLGFLAQKTLNTTIALLAKADTRSWVTLPSNILMSRFYMPEGSHDITVHFLNSNRGKVKSQKITVNVKDGEKTFVVVESFK